MIGNKHGLGKPYSNEKKEKIKKALQGKPFTETHRQNISKAKKESQLAHAQKKQK